MVTESARLTAAATATTTTTTTTTHHNAIPMRRAAADENFWSRALISYFKYLNEYSSAH